MFEIQFLSIYRGIIKKTRITRVFITTVGWNASDKETIHDGLLMLW